MPSLVEGKQAIKIRAITKELDKIRTIKEKDGKIYLSLKPGIAKVIKKKWGLK